MRLGLRQLSILAGPIQPEGPGHRATQSQLLPPSPAQMTAMPRGRANCCARNRVGLGG